MIKPPLSIPVELRFRRRCCVWLAVVALLAATAAAQNTRHWDQSRFEEFEKGTAKGVSIRSDGALELAPSFRQIGSTSSTYIWSAASDSEGNLYAAAGSPARVYRVTPAGQVSIVFSAPELQAQAVVVDRGGAIYAATSPDGRVYRITRNPGAAEASAPKPSPVKPSATATDAEKPRTPSEQVDPNSTSQVYFEPKTKYIWALALDAQGRLYVATGDHGEIFRVDKSGSGSVFFKSDEAHIRALALDREGNLIAGSDGSGLVYRITPAGQGFVLYGAPKKEITALALDAAGNIYASAAGERRLPTPAPAMTAPGVTGAPPGAVTPGAPGAPRPPAPTPAPTAPAISFPLPGLGAAGSDIYRIAPDGSPKRIWSSREDLVYALTFDRAGRLIAGTGNKGRIYAVTSDGFSDLLKASANQVTGFAPAPNGGIYTVCSNLGKIFLMEDSSQREGTFDSDVFDARIFSRWGRVELRGQGAVDLYARSGNVDNPDRNWSPWHKIDLKTGQTEVPAARYVQWRAVLHSGSTAPRVNRVEINYLPKNVAPEVDDVMVVVGGHPISTGPASGALPHVAVPVNTGNPAGPPPPFAGPSATPARPEAGIAGRGNITVRWAAHDENGDRLTFSIYYRADGDSRWLLLKDGISERSYSFDPTLLPDGGYTLRVVASDAPSHPPSEALTGWKDSPHFDVDTTPPAISNLKAALDGNRLHISFTAADSFSIIQRAEYSIDAGPWQVAAPVGEISDSRSENYDFSAALPEAGSTQAPGELPSPPSPAPSSPARSRRRRSSAPPAVAVPQEHIIVVRVYDRADNVVTAKTVVNPPIAE